MCGLIKYFRETHIVGRRCREWMLSSEHFPVLRKAPFIWIGYSVLRPPYRMVRIKSVHSHMVAVVEGEGRTLVDGKLVKWKPGQVLIAPVGQHHAFEIASSRPWTIAWVFWDDHERAPVLRDEQPRLVEADATDFVSLIRLLVREAAGASEPAMIDALSSALEASAKRLGKVDSYDHRLWRIWTMVENDLSFPWTVTKLARLASVSEEHLRRLCQNFHQRSPMEYVGHLRMRRASMILRSSVIKIEELAHQVGYSSVYAFSVAFSRWSGMAPGRYRRNSIK